MTPTLDLPKLVPMPEGAIRVGRAIGQHGRLAALTMIAGILAFVHSDVVLLSWPGLFCVAVVVALAVFSVFATTIGAQCAAERNVHVLRRLEFFATFAPEIVRFQGELQGLGRGFTCGEARQIMALCHALMISAISVRSGPSKQ